MFFIKAKSPRCIADHSISALVNEKYCSITASLVKLIHLLISTCHLCEILAAVLDLLYRIFQQVIPTSSFIMIPDILHNRHLKYM